MFDSKSIIKAFKNQEPIQTKALSWAEFLNLLAGLEANN
ncbi:Putative uncharacterized protein [Moritella viscosa]|nr:Putative uncharacterized protein [Moritella viscosa]